MKPLILAVPIVVLILAFNVFSISSQKPSAVNAAPDKLISQSTSTKTNDTVKPDVEVIAQADTETISIHTAVAEDSAYTDTYTDTNEPAEEESVVMDFSEIPLTDDRKTRALDPQMLANGTVFDAKGFEKLKDLKEEAPVELQLPGYMLDGNISQITTVPAASDIHQIIDFSDSEFYMSASHYQNLSKGKIYLDGESLIFEHNGDIGVYMTIYDYKEMYGDLRHD